VNNRIKDTATRKYLREIVGEGETLCGLPLQLIINNGVLNMNIENVRGWQLSHMENAMKSFEHLVYNANPDDLIKYRDNGEGWSVVAVLCHLRDWEEVFLHRAKITVEKENPDLPFPKPDDVAAEKHYFEQDPQTVLSEWKAHRANLMTYFKERRETEWERPAVHPVRGNFTLHDQLFIIAQHDMLHFEQALRTLAEKRQG
jgi:hypothetical protein